MALCISCSEKAVVFDVDPGASRARYPLLRVRAFQRNMLMGENTRVLFTYDYWLGEHEVTQGEFRALMGYIPDLPADFRGDLLPVVGITAAEAALFCNALSRRDGLDSVYGYLRVEFSSDNRVIQVEGLRADLTRNGYRLPTEAEWEFAAGGARGYPYPWGMDTGMVAEYAWVVHNAGGRLHAVCTRKKNGGFCDLVGNALEMTGDWLGVLPPGEVRDYAGYAEPNVNREIVVKGGSFLHAVSAAARARRSDVYSITWNSTQTYLGFRVARGPVSTPRFASGGALLDGSERIRVTASQRDIRDFFGTRYVRLVAVNGVNGVLYGIYYALPGADWQAVPGIPADVLPKHPAISPDGRWIAFGTRSEGQFGTSRMYLVPSELYWFGAFSLGDGAIPRWWVDSSGRDTALIYVTSARNNADSGAWTEESTVKIRLGPNFSREDYYLTAGAYHGGLDASGRFLVTSAPVLRALDLHKNQSKDLFLFPENGKDSSGSTQVCNASISPAGPARVMFLDFGFEKTSSLVGRSYGIHEYLFILDLRTGNVVDTLRVPEGWAGWADPEWSNHPDYAISGVTDAAGNKKALYAIHLPTHRVLKLAEGSLETPGLWINPGRFEQESDSLGLYVYPYREETRLFAGQIASYWPRAAQVSGVILGSSRCFNGVIAENLSVADFQNLCLAQGGSVYSALRVLDYLWVNSPRLRYIVLSLDLDLWFRFPAEDWSMRFGVSAGYRYDSLHGFWSAGLPRNFLEIVRLLAPPPIDANCTDRGTCPISRNITRPAECSQGSFGGTGAQTVEASLNILQEILERSRRSGVRVLGLMSPQRCSNSPYYGRYGISLAAADTIKARIEELRQEYEATFRVLDLHQNNNHGWPDSLFADTDHLLITGAYWMTECIDSALRAWEDSP